MPSFTVITPKRNEIINITDKINGLIKESGVQTGICNVFTTHATAAIIINESYDTNLCADIINSLNKIIPEHDDYLHDKIDNNAAAHIKAALLGPGETIPIKNNQLLLGTWQSVSLVELDGPKKRTVIVTIIGD